MTKMSLDPREIRDIETRVGVSAVDLLRRYHGRDPNVVGVAYGPRERCGEVDSSEVCVTFFVGKKRPKNLIEPARVLPETLPELDQASTDVIEAGGFRACSERYRPALGGVSISGVHLDPVSGSENAECGTLACRAYRDGILGGRRRWYALSNAHVMAQKDGSGAVGDVISQPSFADSMLWEENRIARLSQWIPISADPAEANYVDAAIAAVDHSKPGRPSATLGTSEPLISDQILELGRVAEWRRWYDIVPGLAVAKRGAGLDVRKDGEVSHILGSFYVTFGASRCLFESQILARMLTVGGDSGALMVTPAAIPDRETLYHCSQPLGAVGLVFAASTQNGVFYTLANYIEAVQTLLNVRVADRVYSP